MKQNIQRYENFKSRLNSFSKHIKNTDEQEIKSFNLKVLFFFRIVLIIYIFCELFYTIYTYENNLDNNLKLLALPVVAFIGNEVIKYITKDIDKYAVVNQMQIGQP